MEELPQFEVLDYVMLVGNLLVSLGIGLFYAVRGNSSNKDFLMAGKSMSFIPVACSLLASYLSSLTIIGIPGEVYAFGAQIYAIYIGMALGMLFATCVFIPILYRMEVTSIYEFLEMRFRSRFIKLLTSFKFIFQMLLYMGVVLYAPTLSLTPLTSVPSWVILLVTGLVCTVYTALGGMRAVLWTDVFQLLVMYGGMILVLIVGIGVVGGFEKVFQLAQEGGRLNLSEFHFDVFQRHSFWMLSLHSFQIWVATFGCTQTQVQRFCSMKSGKDIAKTLFITVPFAVLLGLSVVVVGLVVYAYNAGCDPVSAGQLKRSDEVFPLFVLKELAYLPGVRGAFIACLFSASLSTLSSGFNSVAGVIWEDFLKNLPYFSDFSDRKITITTKLLAFLIGFIVIVIGVLAQNLGTIFQSVGTILGMTSGPGGAIFWLALFFPFVNRIGAITGIVVGYVITFWISIGGMVYSQPPTTLQMSIDNCTGPVNYTSPKIPEEFEGIKRMYQISYLMYTIIGMAVTMVVSIVVSICTGCMVYTEEDKRFMAPWAWKLYKRFMPHKIIEKGHHLEVADENNENDWKQSTDTVTTHL